MSKLSPAGAARSEAEDLISHVKNAARMGSDCSLSWE